MKTEKKDNNKILKFLLSSLIVISTFFLAVGYAALSDKNLKVNLIVKAEPLQTVFISNVDYSTDNNADLASSEILEYTGTMLHSKVALSPTDISSSITYQVTIFNNSDAIKQFKGISYLDGLYTNNDILYSIDGLAVGDTIAKGASKTFSLTFSYQKNISITNSNLESYLNFNFDYYYEEENEVDITISADGGFSFEGVSAENPIDLANIANISFSVKNGTDKKIVGVQVDVIYSTFSGSKQSTRIDLLDEEHNLLSNKTVSFEKKVTNTLMSIIFDNLSINVGDILHVTFDKETITNGKVDVSGVTIIPIFE